MTELFQDGRLLIFYRSGYKLTRESCGKRTMMFFRSAIILLILIGWQAPTLSQEPSSTHGPIEQARIFVAGKDYAAAIELLLPLAEKGYASAQLLLADIYYIWRPNDELEDGVAAVAWYRRAAEQGDAEAQSVLASLYLIGSSVEQSDTDALYWYLLAAEQDDLDAQYELGEIYYQGKGVEVDFSISFYWSHKAAEKGNSLAQFSVAYAYEHGEGVEKDLAQAAQWYRKAADQGDEGAEFRLKQLNLIDKTTP